MSEYKNALIAEQEARDEEAKAAEYAARGLRDKKQPPEYDAFDYCYDHDILPVPPEPCSAADLRRLADEHLRLSMSEPLGDPTIFMADQ